MSTILKSRAMSDEVADLLREARALEGEMPLLAGELYARALGMDPANLDAHNAIERLQAPGWYGEWMRVDCRIHPDDDIFRFFAEYPGSRNPIRDYLADGWRSLGELMVALERIGRPLLGMDSVLEFASGFGRFTRHLSRVLPGRVTCADVMPGSAEFLRETFGVKAFPSCMEPESIRFPERYDLVFVLSLFTHLPVTVWGRWLRALSDALAADGVLLFTVHNEEASRAAGIGFDADGVRYLPSSESPSLGGDHYGTTFTTRAVVERQVVEALGRPPRAILPIAFWAGQDAVVV
ncbi:MAG TPA: class I SAM-dependent methyltransferase [Xanthomonadaceae bacterium]|nr:class I SAM-dependent methyltransferase [Xanthomonadaceae bacterium]